MPYRRLPNTDSARIRAMKAALDKGKNLPPFELAYSQAMYVKLKSFMSAFEKAVQEQRIATQLQAKNNKQYLTFVKKAQMYLSHFVQVLNLSILREELPGSIRTLYGLKANDKKVPALNTEEEIINTGKKIIEGEEKRTRRGGTPLLNPKISMVKMHYEKFLDACHHQKVLKDSSARSQLKVASLRAQADSIILEIWNNVEKHFEENLPEARRSNCIEYGLVYVYRKKEVHKTSPFLQLSA
ncbi:MAG: hypothetical protein ABFS35_12710 [Bacteroidota bacterium]